MENFGNKILFLRLKEFPAAIISKIWKPSYSSNRSLFAAAIKIWHGAFAQIGIKKRPRCADVWEKWKFLETNGKFWKTGKIWDLDVPRLT